MCVCVRACVCEWVCVRERGEARMDGGGGGGGEREREREGSSNGSTGFSKQRPREVELSLFFSLNNNVQKWKRAQEARTVFKDKLSWCCWREFRSFLLRQTGIKLQTDTVINVSASGFQTRFIARTAVTSRVCTTNTYIRLKVLAYKNVFRKLFEQVIATPLNCNKKSKLEPYFCWVVMLLGTKTLLVNFALTFMPTNLSLQFVLFGPLCASFPDYVVCVSLQDVRSMPHSQTMWFVFLCRMSALCLIPRLCGVCFFAGCPLYASFPDYVVCVSLQDVRSMPHSQTMWCVFLCRMSALCLIPRLCGVCFFAGCPLYASFPDYVVCVSLQDVRSMPHSQTMWCVFLCRVEALRVTSARQPWSSFSFCLKETPPWKTWRKTSLTSASNPKWAEQNNREFFQLNLKKKLNFSKGLVQYMC